MKKTTNNFKQPASNDFPTPSICIIACFTTDRKFMWLIFYVTSSEKTDKRGKKTNIKLTSTSGDCASSNETSDVTSISFTTLTMSLLNSNDWIHKSESAASLTSSSILLRNSSKSHDTPEFDELKSITYKKQNCEKILNPERKHTGIRKTEPKKNHKKKTNGIPDTTIVQKHARMNTYNWN